MPLASNLLVLATAVPQSRSRHNLDACTKLNKQRNPRTTKLYTLLVYLLALHTKGLTQWGEKSLGLDHGLTQ